MHGYGGAVRQDPVRQHFNLPHPHLHWPHHTHVHLHWGHHNAGTASAHVGRTGTLAVALGIGSAAFIGSCLGCADAAADIGDRGSSAGGPETSTSQSEEANRRGSKPASATVSAGPTRRLANRQPAAATRAARSSAANPSAEEIHLNLPDAAMAPASVGADAPVSVPDLKIPAAAVPAAVRMASQDIVAPQPAIAPKAFLPAAMPLHPTVLIASPAAANPTLATTFTNVLTSLSKAFNGGAPTVPADTSLALMLGASRRETAVPLTSAARRVVTTAAATTATSSTTTTSTVEAEKMKAGGSARVVSDSKASSRSAVAIVGNATVTTTVTIPASTALTIRARTTSGAPNLTVSIDGVPITTVAVTSTSYADYAFAGAIPAGTHSISISSSNATSTSSLYLDKLSTSAGPVGDQFTGKSGSTANSTMWTTTTGTGWDSGIQNYVSNGAYLDGQGHLVIQSTRNSSGGYTSGRIQTANKMSFGYGTITARIKVPKGQALWPAFWMIGADEATNGWPAVGEIDVMELPSTTTTMYSTLHGPITGSTATQQAQIISTLPDLSTDYHNYWVRHLPDEITFGVDDQTLGTLTPADLAPGETWVYNRPMSVVINLAVGGPWAGAPDSTTPAKAQMLVDSVTFVPA